MATLPPVRLTTMQAVTDGHCCSASSTLAFSGTFLPPRRPSSAVDSKDQLSSPIPPAPPLPPPPPTGPPATWPTGRRALCPRSGPGRGAAAAAPPHHCP